MSLSKTTAAAEAPISRASSSSASTSHSRSQSRSSNTNGALVTRESRLDLMPKHTRIQKKRHRDAERDYGGGRKIDVKSVRDKKLRHNLTSLESKYKTAAIRAKDAEILHENTPGFLETESELERTYKVRQDEIALHSSVANATKRFELKLDSMGPYVFDYSRNGRELLLAGRKGHVATMDWRDGKLGCEVHLGETVRDAKWLHNNQFFAVAQKKYVYIYDRNGVEIHCLRKHVEVSHMEFLPYHFLLATLGNTGYLKYQDTSTGKIVAEIPTRLGTPVSLGQNPWNAILHVGHQNGAVTLWSPNSQEPLVKLLAHRGPVQSLAMDRQGRYMVSTGQDLKMAVWDVRMFREVHNYYTRQPGSSVSISDTGLTAVTWGTSATIWKGLFSDAKVQDPYMAWGGEGRHMERARWCPLDDVLGLGHDAGFSSILVPGAGEANYDALEINPYETHQQRRETEVRGLLNKLQPEMISLQPDFIGDLDARSDAQRRAERDLDTPQDSVGDDLRKRMRGKNSTLKKYMRKQRKKNIIDEKRMRIDELWEKQQQQDKEKKVVAQEELGPALARFARSG